MNEDKLFEEEFNRFRSTCEAWQNCRNILSAYLKALKKVIYDGFDTNVINSKDIEYTLSTSQYLDTYITGFLNNSSNEKVSKLWKEKQDDSYYKLEQYVFKYPSKEDLISNADFTKLKRLQLDIPYNISSAIPNESLNTYKSFLDKNNHNGSPFNTNLGSFDWEMKFVEKPALGLNEQLKDLISSKNEEFKKIYNQWKILIDSLESLKNGNAESIQNLVKLANYRHFIPKFFKLDYDVYFDESSKILLIEFEFPDYKNIDIPLRKSKSRSTDYIYASKSEKKKIISETLYSLIIRSGFLASSYLPPFLVELIVINVRQKWFDPATGNNKEGIIATVQGKVDDFKNLNLSQIDPEACIRNLKGIVTSSLEKINPVRPIYQLNKEDKRFIKSKQVDSKFEQDYNLAAMPWEDFEHLVAQLFEWEFAKGGIEVRVTRASRDRGVDAILFDPDPLKGGKYVLQAKRYTNVVDVSSVRDLYGTVMNEGANRGILITTSSYGPDAYEFVKDKPISLVDGPNLLLMLEKHGRKFSIDLIEAKRILKEDDI